MSKPRSHQLDIYGVWLHHARDDKAWQKLQRRIDSLPDIEAGALGFTSRDIGDDGSINLSVFVDRERLNDNPVGLTEILAHEATRAAGMLLDHIGQEYDGLSEALAYLVGFIAAWLHEGCRA
ncbi:hypothetical protein KVF89_22440 [Nocardioides carbamazepini]|uniref:hypothetical protein n=1 Tax=Nocardioides carbamazepini TaxID=2854259 RepID=UPI00214A3CA0|nr:hypothetical protein [Nocardioides carbamazepini]MCR1785316.1 hypothetical protein [Nocardioides carbamazepini]